MRSSLARAFTPSPLKLFSHPEQLAQLRDGAGRTAIGTHMSITGACNLRCDFCSFRSVGRSGHIALEVLKDYVAKLQARGLRSVTLTGGGEPTLHPEFNEFVEWLVMQRLAIGLITNGTRMGYIEDTAAFDWIRVSINIFTDWKTRIEGPRDRKEGAAFGASFVYANETVGEIRAVAEHAKRIGAEYLRIAPSYMLAGATAAQAAAALADKCADIESELIRVVDNVPRKPRATFCALPNVRPCLSDDGGGAVYPCWRHSLPDSGHGPLCAPSEIQDYLDALVPSTVKPYRDCADCPCADTVEALASWLTGAPGRHDLFV
jgi:MoaA/NifB/PqqE/SkfB family radical SAM enzyme